MKLIDLNRIIVILIQVKICILRTKVIENRKFRIRKVIRTISPKYKEMKQKLIIKQ